MPEKHNGHPRVIYISDDCKIEETKDDIMVTEPNGEKHYFAKGSYVFTKRDNISSWD